MFYGFIDKWSPDTLQGLPSASGHMGISPVIQWVRMLVWNRAVLSWDDIFWCWMFMTMHLHKPLIIERLCCSVGFVTPFPVSNNRIGCLLLLKVISISIYVQTQYILISDIHVGFLVHIYHLSTLDIASIILNWSDEFFNWR